MKRRMVIAAALLLVSGGAALAQGTDWTTRFSTAKDGAFVMGNPAAKVKLVEYLSYTCNHCAHFAMAASQPLRRDFVASGKTSVQVRHAVRDRLDFTATLLARCGGPSRFFRNNEVIMAAQPAWMDQANRYAASEPATLASLPMNDAIKKLARGSGLVDLMREQGLTEAQLDACLTDAGQQKIIGDMAAGAWKTKKIPGTPFFTINGRDVADTANWTSLEPKLRAAQN
jgi:protein-disulfide isomerase